MITKELLIELANCKMPFGKYKDRYLSDIPEEYYIWFSHKGFPQDRLGELMGYICEMKKDGTSYLLKPLRTR